ncbi:unnamed protein product [Angiostrongylus costaricensis]|uniref:Transposase n=1 Tax=Angiostrongylus costaricensis TaxID=334426 RepID=A0A0R3PSX3_ANGCS|nr:unnamed protein product [Angiostrongylus costaricensis]
MCGLLGRTSPSPYRVCLRGLAKGSLGVLVLSRPDVKLFDFSPTKWYVGFRKREPVVQHIHPALFHMAERGRGYQRDPSSNRE